MPVTLENEKVPEPWQLNEILGAATVRTKVSISFMCFSCVRPGVLGNVNGTDGLVLADLPELDLKALRFTTLPAQAVVRRGGFKGSLPVSIFPHREESQLSPDLSKTES